MRKHYVEIQHSFDAKCQLCKGVCVNYPHSARADLDATPPVKVPPLDELIGASKKLLVAVGNRSIKHGVTPEERAAIMDLRNAIVSNGGRP